MIAHDEGAITMAKAELAKDAADPSRPAAQPTRRRDTDALGGHS